MVCIKTKYFEKRLQSRKIILIYFMSETQFTTAKRNVITKLQIKVIFEV